MTSTTSVVTVVVPQLIAVIAEDPDSPPVFESWPGPEGGPEMIVFGQVEWLNYEIPTIRTGRKARQEDFTLEGDLYVIGVEGTSPANPGPARERAFELLAPLENLLANDVSAGLGFADGIQHIQLHPATAGPVLFERGWAYKVGFHIEIHARLN